MAIRPNEPTALQIGTLIQAHIAGLRERERKLQAVLEAILLPGEVAPTAATARRVIASSAIPPMVAALLALGARPVRAYDATAMRMGVSLSHVRGLVRGAKCSE